MGKESLATAADLLAEAIQAHAMPQLVTMIADKLKKAAPGTQDHIMSRSSPEVVATTNQSEQSDKGNHVGHVVLDHAVNAQLPSSDLALGKDGQHKMALLHGTIPELPKNISR